MAVSKINLKKENTRKLFELYQNNDFKKFSKLIDSGADINCVNSYGESLINMIIKNNMSIFDNKKFFNKMISSGCSLKPIGNDIDPLNNLILSPNDDSYYLQKILKITDNINTGIKICVTKGAYEIFGPPIFMAMEKGNQHVIDLLLKHNIDLKVSNDEGTPVLNFLITVLGHNKKLMSRYLPIFIKHGAPVDEFDNDGNQPIHYWARGHGELELLPLLLKNNANINIRNHEGDTPLKLAVYENDLDTVILLVKNKANVNIRDIDGKTALMISMSWDYYDIANVLIKSSDASICDNYGNNLCHYLASRPSVNTDDVLWKKFEKIMLENPELLLEKNKKGKTPIYILKKTNKKRYSKFMEKLNKEKTNQVSY